MTAVNRFSSSTPTIDMATHGSRRKTLYRAGKMRPPSAPGTPIIPPDSPLIHTSPIERSAKAGISGVVASNSPAAAIHDAMSGKSPMPNGMAMVPIHRTSKTGMFAFAAVDHARASGQLDESSPSENVGFSIARRAKMQQIEGMRHDFAKS
jgi:hypothetical protein